ncbi:MAG: hypothetical protein EXR75_11595 [Myxococcales bacterium]|nr:hypothetical protein [Myxococcales bacterium]
MSRTTAEALALVNWKGVFYVRYGLDRHVTASTSTCRSRSVARPVPPGSPRTPADSRRARRSALVRR